MPYDREGQDEMDYFEQQGETGNAALDRRRLGLDCRDGFCGARDCLTCFPEGEPDDKPIDDDETDCTPLDCTPLDCTPLDCTPDSHAPTAFVLGHVDGNPDDDDETETEAMIRMRSEREDCAGCGGDTTNHGACDCEPEHCETCKGQGEVFANDRTGDRTIPCPDCDGRETV